MEPKGNKIVRRVIYFILFAGLAACFVFLGEKYKSNSEVREYTIKDYYPDMSEKLFTVVNGSGLIDLLRSKESHLIMVGSSKSVYSQKYIEEISLVANSLGVEKIYYYDSYNDKSQKNSNYYEIRNLLEGYLTTTDGSTKNLLAPSFYVIRNGEVKYYNTETVAMKNTDSVEKYWTDAKELEFTSEIALAINKYYLNK